MQSDVQNPPTPAPPPVLDTARLETLRSVPGQNGRPFLFEFAEMFEADTSQCLNQLKEFVSLGDTHQVRHLAHGLKGSCRNLGATEMAEACLRLEAHSSDAAILKGDELLHQLLDAYDRVHHAIRREIRS